MKGIRFYSANDASSRDPSSFILEGAQSPNGPFTVIYGSTVTLPGDRNATGLAIDPNTQATTDVTFTTGNTVFTALSTGVIPGTPGSGGANGADGAGTTGALGRD